VGVNLVDYVVRANEVKNYNKYLEKCVNILNLNYVYDTIQMFVAIKRLERLILMEVR